MADNYWMYFRGIADCLGKQTVAILHYNNAGPIVTITPPKNYDEMPADLFVSCAVKKIASQKNFALLCIIIPSVYF